MNSAAKFLCLIVFPALMVVLHFLAGSSAYCQQESGNLPSQPLSLRNAVDYALVHNRTYLAARQELDAAGQQVRQARADFFPRLNTRYSYTAQQDPPYAVFDDLKFDIAPKDFNRWEIELIQPLFTGHGLTSQLRIAEMSRKISEYQLEQTRLDVVRDVERAFWDVLLGEKLLKVVRDNVSNLSIQRRHAAANYQQGLVAQNDVLKADVALAQARQKERSAEKQLTILRFRLNQLLDLPLGTHLTLVEEEITLRNPPDLDRLYTIAESRRPEYLAVETSIKQAEEGITAARSRYYPQVSAFGQYYREGEDFLAKDNPYTNNENAAVGVKVEWNWFEGGKTEAKAKEYRYRQRAQEEKRQALRQQIRLQVEDAYEQLKVARDNLATAQAAVKQAEENERMTSLQYQEQLVIFLEVLNAQLFLSQTQVDYYQALYGFQLAWVDLERATGGVVEPVR